MFGYVLKRSDNDFVVNIDLNDCYSGYNVVPKNIDPDNIYNVDEVKAYCEANPDRVIQNHPMEGQVNLIKERAGLLIYLKNTDYTVVKCMERGLSMREEYPNEYIKRQTARERINEITALLEGQN